MELWQQAADGNNAEAHYLLGRAHETGRGLPLNLTQALKTYSQGYSRAPYVAEAVALSLAWYGAHARAWLFCAVRFLHPFVKRAKAGTQAVQLSSVRVVAGLDALGGWQTLCTLCVSLAGVLWLRRLRRLQRARRPC